jgi:hypothetical protein
MWDNKYSDPVCGGGNTCSDVPFKVTAGQKFYVVGDIFDGAACIRAIPGRAAWTCQAKAVNSNLLGWSQKPTARPVCLSGG